MAHADVFEILYGDLPDARLRSDRRHRTDVAARFIRDYGERYDLVFCVNCGASGGACTKDTTHILYLCEPCSQKWGKLPLPEVPEEFVR